MQPESSFKCELATRMWILVLAWNTSATSSADTEVGAGAAGFSLVDSTNLPSLDAPQVHAFEVQFVDNDRIVLTFLFQSGPRESRKRSGFTRVIAPHPQRTRITEGTFERKAGSDHFTRPGAYG